jgi:hypothetical protein
LDERLISLIILVFRTTLRFFNSLKAKHVCRSCRWWRAAYYKPTRFTITMNTIYSLRISFMINNSIVRRRVIRVKIGAYIIYRIRIRTS